MTVVGWARCASRHCDPLARNDGEAQRRNPSTDWPDGQFLDPRVQPPLQKYSASRRPDSNLYPPPSRPTEGRIRIVRDAGRDAVDAAALGACVVAGRVLD